MATARIIFARKQRIPAAAFHTLHAISVYYSARWDDMYQKRSSSAADYTSTNFRLTQSSNDVMVTLRVTNHANKKHDVDMGFDLGTAVDSDSNLTNNVYVIKGANHNAYLGELEPNLPVNIQGIIKGVPTTSSYLSH